MVALQKNRDKDENIPSTGTTMQPGVCRFDRTLPVFSQIMLLTSLSASKSDTSIEGTVMLRKLSVQNHQKAIETAISETHKWCGSQTSTHHLNTHPWCHTLQLSFLTFHPSTYGEKKSTSRQDLLEYNA